MHDQLFSTEEWKAIVSQLVLSPRQAEIAALILKDLKDDVIARTLGISKATVRSHIRELFQRLGVASRLGIAVAIFSAYRKAELRHK